MRRRVLAPLGALATVCVLVAGCVPSAPPTPTPTPSAPSPSAVPTPTENAQEREERIAYGQAEAAYRTYSREMDRVLADGGSQAASSKLKAVAAGPFLDDQTGVIRSFYEEKKRSTGQVVVISVKPQGYSPAELRLLACADGTSVKTFDRHGKQIVTGYLAEEDLLVRKIGPTWKIWQDKAEEVETCAP